MRSDTVRLAAAWLLLCGIGFAMAVPEVEELGLYYDEAFIAQQARDFVEPDRAAVHPDSVRFVEIAGRRFPTRNAAYLGSLKSQLQIPFFAVFGTGVSVLRLSTLCIALLSLLLAMLFVRRVSGTGPAIGFGILLALDPNLQLLGRYEWGPFTTNLLCRCGALYLLCVGHASASRARRIGAFAGAGILVGLGVFSRADFGVIAAACALGLVAARPDLLRVYTGPRRIETVAALATALLFASPMLGSVGALLSTSSGIADRGGLSDKAAVLWSTLDGSHFLRLMEVGGRFEALFEVDAPGGLFGWVLIACAAISSIAVSGQHRRGLLAEQLPLQRFLLVTCAVVTAGMLALPGAVRAHHQLNAMPFYTLLVSSVCAGLFEAARICAGPHPKLAWLFRGGAVAFVVATLASHVALLGATRDVVRETGGRGRFSLALTELAREIDAEPGAVAVSLDWGFHENLAFLTNRARLEEPIWEIPRQLRRRQAWETTGGPERVYLVHDAPYDLFGLSPRFLTAVRELPARYVNVRLHLDGGGDVAFLSVRFARPHRIRFDGRFRIQLEGIDANEIGTR